MKKKRTTAKRKQIKRQQRRTLSARTLKQKQKRPQPPFLEEKSATEQEPELPQPREEIPIPPPQPLEREPIEEPEQKPEEERPVERKAGKKFPGLILHPLFFGLFPILFLYATNIREMPLSEIWLPLAITAGVAIVATLLLGLVFRNFFKSGIIVSIGMGVFFSYGRLADLTRDWQLPYRQFVILGALVCAAVAGIVFLLRTRRNLLPLTKILNFAGGVLVAIQVAVAAAGLAHLKDVGAAGISQLKAGGVETAAREAAPSPKGAPAVPVRSPAADYPDIYYIVLDGYGRLDTMAKYYNYDNSVFVRFLEDAGFKVFAEARPNYCQTLLSLSCVLNMEYIDDFIRLDKSGDDRAPLVEKIRHNALFDFLKARGYTIVTFSSGYDYTEIPGADVYLKPSGSLSEFQNILLTTTTLSIVEGRTAFDNHRRRIAYTLNTIPHLPVHDRPSFVFAHLVCPHPPFVFGPNGEKVETKFGFSFLDGDGYMGQGGTAEEYTRGYFDQMTYLNKLIRVMVSQLIVLNSENPPVIVLQADHGPGIAMDFLSAQRTNLRDRFGILYALYLPGHAGEWSAIQSSPVNTFRVVLNQCLGANFLLLDPHSYYSTWPRPFLFTEITDRLGDEPAVTPAGADVRP